MGPSKQSKADPRLTRANVIAACLVAALLGSLAFLDSRVFPRGEDAGDRRSDISVDFKPPVHSTDLGDSKAAGNQRAGGSAPKLRTRPTEQLSVSGDGTVALTDAPAPDASGHPLAAEVTAIFMDAEKQVRRQQYAEAGRALEKAVEKADSWLSEMRRGGSRDKKLLDEARKLCADAHFWLTSFHLDRGNVRAAQHVLADFKKTARDASMPGPLRLLEANALRDEGKFVAAVAVYKDLVSEEELFGNQFESALALGELARAELLRGRHKEDAQALLGELDGDLENAPWTVKQRIAGWLGAAELAMGRPAEALAALDRALSQVDKTTPVLADATAHVQEAFQLRSLARKQLADLPGAQRDIEVVWRLQEQLWAAVLSNRGETELPQDLDKVTAHPDAVLRGLMARSLLIRAELLLAETDRDAKARVDAAEEALEFVEKAERILRETAEHGSMPRGPGVATVAEAERMALVARTRANDAWEEMKAAL